jgi:hypothetical protein
LDRPPLLLQLVPMPLFRPQLFKLEIGDDEVGRLFNRLEDVDEPVSDDVNLGLAAARAGEVEAAATIPRTVVLTLKYRYKGLSLVCTYIFLLVRKRMC